MQDTQPAKAIRATPGNPRPSNLLDFDALFLFLLLSDHSMMLIQCDVTGPMSVVHAKLD